MEDAGLVDRIDEVAAGVGDIEDAVEVEQEAARRDEAGRDGAARPCCIDFNHIVGRSCLGDEQIVEAVDVDRSWRVEARDITGVDRAVGAEAGDGAVGRVRDEKVSGRVDCERGRSEQTCTLRNYDLWCAAAGRKKQKIGSARPVSGLENIGVAGGVNRNCSGGGQ